MMVTLSFSVYDALPDPKVLRSPAHRPAPRSGGGGAAARKAKPAVVFSLKPTERAATLATAIADRQGVDAEANSAYLLRRVLANVLSCEGGLAVVQEYCFDHVFEDGVVHAHACQHRGRVDMKGLVAAGASDLVSGVAAPRRRRRRHRGRAATVAVAVAVAVAFAVAVAVAVAATVAVAVAVAVALVAVAVAVAVAPPRPAPPASLCPAPPRPAPFRPAPASSRPRRQTRRWRLRLKCEVLGTRATNFWAPEPI